MISDQDFTDIIERIERDDPNTTKLEFNTKETLLGSKHVERFAQALQRNKTLKSLLINNTLLDEGKGTPLFTAFGAHPQLQYLSLTEAAMCDEGATALADALRRRVSLLPLELSLKGNGITEIGAIALAQALIDRSSKAPIKLHLDHNRIDDAGASAFARALEVDNTISFLSLEHNWIHETGAIALAKALAINTSLECLYLSSNRIYDTGATALVGAVAANADSALKILRLSNTAISDAGAIALANAVQHHKSIRQLSLCDNQISEVGATALVDAVENNRALESVYLAGNDLVSPSTHDTLERKCEYNTDYLQAVSPVLDFLAATQRERDRHTKMNAAAGFLANDGDHAIMTNVVRFLMP